jgi:hypothetical protein
MIRTFTYVFLLDTAFVIFNNAPPRMVLHEMDLEMTAPEICFQADNSTSCYTYWHCYLSSQLKTPVLPPVLLAEAISILVQDNYGEYSHRFTNMSVLNLFTLVAGRHYQLNFSHIESNPVVFNRPPYGRIPTTKLIHLLTDSPSSHQKCPD